TVPSTSGPASSITHGRPLSPVTDQSTVSLASARNESRLPEPSSYTLSERSGEPRSADSVVNASSAAPSSSNAQIVNVRSPALDAYRPTTVSVAATSTTSTVAHDPDRVQVTPSCPVTSSPTS